MHADLLKKTPSSRIVVVSSAAHPYGFFDIDNMNCEKEFNGFFLYCNSKLCNIFMAQHLAEKLVGTGNSVSLTERLWSSRYAARHTPKSRLPTRRPTGAPKRQID